MIPEGDSPPMPRPESRQWFRPAVPLLGVFLAGLLIDFALACQWPVAELLKRSGDLDTSLRQISFPLAVYSVLYVGCLEPALTTQRTIKRTMRNLAELGLLFIIVILLFPYLIIGVLLVVGLFFTSSAAFFILPLLAGVLYGAVLSFIASRTRPQRLAGHLFGGGLVGVLVLHLYLLQDIGATVAAGDRSGFDVFFAGIEHAGLLALCYVPHALVTHLWQRIDAPQGAH